MWDVAKAPFQNWAVGKAEKAHEPLLALLSHNVNHLAVASASKVWLERLTRRH